MRLTKQVKESIVKAAVKKSGVLDKQAAIRSRYAAWAERVRVIGMTPEMEETIEQAKALLKPVTEANPDRNVSDSTQCLLFVNVAGCSRKFFFNGNADKDDGTPSVYKRAPYSSVVLKADDPLVAELYDIDHDSKAVNDEHASLLASLWAVLDSVSTDKKLYEVWPEAKAFVPAAERAASVNLPALPISELNKLIGLP